MDPTLTSMDAHDEKPKERVKARQLLWLLSLVLRYRATILLGLLSTVLFAGLHTIGIGAAFPVFKILLEEEGLRGWVDRTVAGQRIGATFAPPSEPDSVRVVKVSTDSDLHRQGVRAGDDLCAADETSAAELWHRLASARPGETLEVWKLDSLDDGQRDRLLLKPAAPELHHRVLGWAVSLLPLNADQEKLRTLARLLAALIGVVILANVFRYFGEVLIAKAVLRAMMRLRTDLYARTLHLPMSFFTAQPTADIVGRFVQDVQEIQRGMLTLLSKSTREPLRAIFILGLAFAVDWRITLVVAVITPIAVLVFWRIGRSVKKSNRKLLQAYGRMIGALTASLQHLRVVKAYTAEESERERLLRVDKRVFKQQLKLAKLQAFVSPMIETVAVIAGSCLIIWFAGRVLNHGLELSKFGGLSVTLSMLFEPLRKLTDVYVRIQRATAGAERVFHVLNQPIEAEPGDVGRAVKPLADRLEFVNVSFTYPGASTPALQDVNLSIRKGETVAIVGPNGCGKTTLVSMLPRLFDPDSGEVRYDGVSVRTVNLKDLRTQIGLVTQEAVVFAGTPAENIAYGRSQTDGARVRDAAERASADEFINGIPGAYEADLAERGTSLSGGQRQRLSIARAIFRDAPILIFDEATSQIDSESELKIQTALQTFAQGRTTLIIAHRLSTIQFADRLVVMDSGRIVDSGSHRELFDRCPLYRTLCETQLGRGPEDS